ncbi:hypothetical protein J1N35_011127 [Gossypium stocksii]|uniref:Uncharacterized protein n=1 Tax=Gossypium stocksii TaxID=47602 RepID=A0A9D3W1V5_9ROSI|nr:hypothetical protein J1N35_011127 [Gossypium stocksii]
MCGDFKEIIYGTEKKGGLPRDERRMDLFRRTLEECQLVDSGYSGRWFTWERGNLLETNIMEWLDRGLQMTSGSEAWWSLEDSFLFEVERIWGLSSGNLIEKLENVKRGLGIWARKIHFNKKNRKQVLTAKLAELYEADRDDNLLVEMIDTKI